MSERAQALEAEVARLKADQQDWRKGVALIASSLGDSGENLSCVRIAEIALEMRARLEALAAPPVGVSPQPDEYRERMRLHDLVLEVLAAWQESENEDDIVKRSRTRTAFRDRLKSPASLSPVESTPSREPLTGAELLDRFRPVEPTPEPPVHNDLCSWCLTQADHVAASEECYERNSQRGRSAPVSTGEPAPAVEREGMTAPKNECGKCRMLGSIGPCDEHGPLGVSPSPVLEPTPEPPKCVCSACEPLVDPGQRPSLEDINRLEKAAWDSKTDRVLVWYRDQIGLYQQRIRETERAWQLERKQKPTGAPAPCVWRDITKERPPHGVNVDVWARGRRIADAYYVVNEGEEPFWCDDEGYNVRDVTHWMPLPAPPQITR